MKKCYLFWDVNLLIVYKLEFEGVKLNGFDFKLMILIKGYDLLVGYRLYVYCLFLVMWIGYDIGMVKVIIWLRDI